MNDEEFVRERVKRLHEIAADADPFIKKRLLRLADDYEKRLLPQRPLVKLTGLETKMPHER